MGSVFILSCSKDDCEGCKGVTIKTFTNQEALIYSGTYTTSYRIELPFEVHYGADLTQTICDSSLVKKLPKNKNGTAVFFSGTGKATCGDKGVSVQGFIYFKV